jgi:ferredoxin
LPSVTFVTGGAGGARTRVEGRAGASLFELARGAGIAVSTACVGKATCGLCRMKVVAGEEALSPFNDAERKHLGNVYFITKQRLSCQARLAAAGDVVVEVPVAR